MALNDDVRAGLNKLVRNRQSYSTSAYDSICSNSRVDELYYCQSAFASSSSAIKGNRPPRVPGSINHDYVVLVMTSDVGDGKNFQFYIVSEKVGPVPGGKGGEARKPGICIGILGKDDIDRLNKNIFQQWDCSSIQVPVNILTDALFKTMDAKYHLLSSNCWSYARKACKEILLLLSEQPNVSSEDKKRLQTAATRVKHRVVGTGVQDFFVEILSWFGLRKRPKYFSE